MRARAFVARFLMMENSRIERNGTHTRPRIILVESNQIEKCVH